MLESGHVVAFTAATGLHRAREFYEGILGLRAADCHEFACVLDANSPTLMAIPCRSPSSVDRTT